MEVIVKVRDVYLGARKDGTKRGNRAVRYLMGPECRPED